jgi:hypothetical protein
MDLLHALGNEKIERNAERESMEQTWQKMRDDHVHGDGSDYGDGCCTRTG